MMPKPQPTFTAEFKNEAVQLARTSGKPKAQIARELGISDSALYAWCRQATEHGSDAFPGKGHQTPFLSRESRFSKRFFYCLRPSSIERLLKRCRAEKCTEVAWFHDTEVSWYQVFLIISEGATCLKCDHQH